MKNIPLFRNPLKSFYYAIRGLGYCIYSQPNMRIHLFFTILAVFLGLFFNLSATEWCLLVLSILGVLITEAINTSIEILVDLVTKKRKYRAMLSKDIAAGAVLLASINAMIIGYFLFFNRLVTLIL